MLALEPGTILGLESGIVLHSLPDQDWFSAFNVETGDQFRLNSTSFWVLEEISEGIVWEQLLADFIDTYEVPRNQGEADLRLIVNEMLEQRVVGRRSHGEEEAEV